MNKKLYLIIVFVCAFCVNFMSVEAIDVNQKGYINRSGVLFYSEANFSGKKVLDTLDTNDEITILDNNLVASNDTTKCSSGFYKASFYWESYSKTYTGYVCSDSITFNVDTSKYASEFASFPTSYWNKLALLKEAHPNWKFTAYKTNLDWTSSIGAESIVGISYIQSSNPIYLSLDEGSYDASSNTYIQKEAGGWYAANKQTVAYYMDPRNFLDEINIFMFENLGYNSNYQTKEVVQNIFKNTNLLNYTDFFIQAATYNGNNISPVSLAARSRQEVVKSDGTLSDSANGSLFKNTQVYNFYNIGAFSSCMIDGVRVENPVMCGLQYAYNKNWNSPQVAILEGSKFIASRYVNTGQNSFYFQRWNVTANNTYSNQYMTNISAPISEGLSTRKAYSSISGLLDSPIEFIIPVYENMSNESSKLPISVDQNKINELKQSASLSKVISDSGYVDNGEYITNIKIGSIASEIINNIKNKSGSAEIASDGNQISGSEKLGTGDIIKISSNGETKSYRIVIYGDSNGDGIVSAVDYVKVKNHIMNSSTLEGSYKLASDVNNDGSISALDYVNIKNYIMGSSSTLK